MIANINVAASDVEITYSSVKIEKMDSYEKCVAKLEDHTAEATATMNSLKKLVGPVSYRFAYPEIESSILLDDIDGEVFLKTLRAVIGTLDPTLREVTISRDLKDTFIIRRNNAEIIIQEGKLLNREILSSGTAEGIDIALFLASMSAKDKTFYYCDEHLIFTTHNTDMLDLNLPKHSYMFLRKKVEDGECKVSAISASEILKRNTDNIRNAVENDVFGSLPDDSLLDELEMKISQGPFWGVPD